MYIQAKLKQEYYDSASPRKRGSELLVLVYFFKKIGIKGGVQGSPWKGERLVPQPTVPLRHVSQKVSTDIHRLLCQTNAVEDLICGALPTDHAHTLKHLRLLQLNT